MARWSLLVVTPSRAWPVELPPGRVTVVGRGRSASLDVGHPSVSERHVGLSVREGFVLLEVLRGALDVRVNDVPVSGTAQLHAGDEVRLGEVRLVASFVPAEPPARVSPLSFDDFLGRLTDEVTRARGRPLALGAIAMPPLNASARQALTRRVIDEVARVAQIAWWGAAASDLLVCCVPDAAGDQVFARLAAVAPRARVATLVSADAPDRLLERLWAQVLGDGLDAVEPIVVDPVMVRLFDVMESLADGDRSVLVVGPPGSGRRTLLQHLLRVAGDQRTVIAPDVARRPEVEGRLLATSEVELEGFDVVVQVPPLRARPLEVRALAEAFLARARSVVGRPRLHLAPDALALLSLWPWPGNVRELKNVMVRAARASVRDEVGRDALPAPLAQRGPTEDLRDALRLAERELLLEALGRTRWNVTATAQRLGMPRRTVVYRMARLGLKRPAR